MDEWMTVEELADALNVDEETVLDWLHSGPLPGVDFGGTTGWKVRRAEFDRFVQQRLNGHTATQFPREDERR